MSVLRLVPWVAAAYALSACASGASSTVTPSPPTSSPRPAPPPITPAPDPGDYQDYVAVCVDSSTQQRIDDEECQDSPTEVSDPGSHPGVGAWWYYYSTIGGGYAAPVGSKVFGGSFITPTSKSGAQPVIGRQGSVPVSGGTIARGGFGGRPGTTTGT
ncbi:hypothetical protein [Saccharopolyspora taberi]|uniref:Lipoprotein n=1 Tax=Saccharopolyspora taberi TaxID=60895 RepID=A0ABN3VA27_9PSEU